MTNRRTSKVPLFLACSLVALLVLTAVLQANAAPTFVSVRQVTGEQPLIKPPSAERPIEIQPEKSGQAALDLAGRFVGLPPEASALDPTGVDCEQLLGNPTLDVTDISIAPWIELEPVVYFTSGIYVSPPYSFFLEDNDESDPSPTFDAFGQVFSAPSDLREVVIEYNTASLESNTADETRGLIYTVDAGGNLDQGLFGWDVGQSDGAWQTQTVNFTDGSDLALMEGRNLAIIFLSDTTGSVPGEIVFFDDVTFTACHPDSTIIVEKVTDPSGSTQQFSFDPSWSSVDFDLRDGQHEVSPALYPGVYTVQEAVPDGWELTSATCDDGSSVDAISLQEGETVTCTFVNTMEHLFIDVWYGDAQQFGQLGNPQQWVNIVGTVNGLLTTDDLTYRLNGGPEQALAIGPDGLRLDNPGDFNVELDYADLDPGSNVLQLRASDGVSETVRTVTVNYNEGSIWPANYNAVWSSSSAVQDIAQVVDGHWRIDGDAVYIDEASWGYQRLLTIGDESWTDYEVTFPVTVHALDPAGFSAVSNGPALGMILRWQGHDVDPNMPNAQPRLGWQRMGAAGWYHWKPDLTDALELRGFDWSAGSSFARELELETEYMFKMSVQSVPEQPAFYRLKFWEASEPEPMDWDLQGFSSENATLNGSLLLVAHHVKATFGEVAVRNLADIRYTVVVTAEGGAGDFMISPDLPDFAYGERVRVYALPDPAYDFDHWSGDYTGNENPADFRIFRDMNLTAHFVPRSTTSLSLAAGWNMVSSATAPSSPDMWSVFAPIIDEVYLVKDGDGNVFWPAEGIDDIGEWDGLSGYQVYMNEPAILLIEGVGTDPQTPIELPAGWSLVAYLRDEPMSAPAALASVADQLTLAKDGYGNVYWPAYDVNSIGDLEPGEGYQLYVRTNIVLRYPP